jgi:hypothetical protein
VVPEDTEAPAGGAACTSTRECAAGEACRGAPGCTSPWACGAPRECGTERVAYCDCDGVTFHAQSGCPNRTYAHVGPCDDPGIADASFGVPNGDEPIVEQDRTCTSSRDCRSGEICFGPAGCGMEWRCERVRGCFRGGRGEFCSCDGETFTATNRCPGRPYVHRGACDEVIAQAGETTPPPSEPPSEPPPTSRPPVSRSPRSTEAAVTPPRPAPPPLEPGQCRTNRDCGRGEVCAGPAGCGEPWTCIRRTERCNPDTQYFCDCDGRSFTASMTCPSRPYVHRGSCAIDQYIDMSGAALR